MLAFRGTLLLVALIGVVIHKVQDPHFVITLLVFCFKGKRLELQSRMWILTLIVFLGSRALLKDFM